MLTEQEKWFFDHHGFIRLQNVVSPEDILRMIELGNLWHDIAQTKVADLPAPLTSTSHTSDRSATIAHWINHIHYADEVFQRLVLNQEIMRVIIALTRGMPCLVDTALTRNFKTSDDIHFHASGQNYGVENGVPYAGFLNAGLSLVNVPEGTGFVCQPGSHKRNFEPPEISIYEGPPTVFNVPVNAGDCVIFTEALYHGGRRWTEEAPRFTIFNRYVTDKGKHTTLPLEAYKHLIPDEIYELEQAVVPGQRKRLVERLMGEIEGQESVK